MKKATKSAKQCYVELIEHNDWEGETWSFWIPLDGNEEAVAKLRALLVAGGDDYVDMFEFGSEMVDAKELDFLRKRTKGDTGYMGRHHKLRGRLEIPDKPATEVLDMLYKGGIYDLMKPKGKK